MSTLRACRRMGKGLMQDGKPDVVWGGFGNIEADVLYKY